MRESNERRYDEVRHREDENRGDDGGAEAARVVKAGRIRPMPTPPSSHPFGSAQVGALSRRRTRVTQVASEDTY
jgi:hypothetical protein